MKRQHIVLLAVASLLIAFGFATYVYTSQQADRIETLATAADSPLERPHSRRSGPADAKVVLVEFFDPACETCRAFAPYVKSLLAAHPDRVRLVLRYAPFHQGSDVAVKILEAAGHQGLYWEALQVMYETQPQWASHHHPQPEKIWEFLPWAGVDVEKARRDMQDPMFAKIIEQDLADGRTLGVRKTPQFFVNGKPLMNFGYQQLKNLLDGEVARQYPQ
ncbi:MAG: thioredoxin domain-containing protein [Myxococcota bacterium]|jgi:protein-disulfide isomerase|nr:thioredoxin domain-containing protein [Myxococcota bacterium]